MPEQLVWSGALHDARGGKGPGATVPGVTLDRQLWAPGAVKPRFEHDRPAGAERGSNRRSDPPPIRPPAPPPGTFQCRARSQISSPAGARLEISSSRAAVAPAALIE